MEGGTMNICLRVLKETNKSRHGTYSVKGMPLRENVYTSKQYLLDNCTGEIAPAIPHIIRDPACWGVILDKEQFPSGKKRKGIVYKLYKTSHILPHLKLNMQVFFIHCHYRFLKLAKLNCNTALRESEDGDEKRESSYDACLSRLRKKHKLPEFKLWSRRSLPVSWGKLID